METELSPMLVLPCGTHYLVIWPVLLVMNALNVPQRHSFSDYIMMAKHVIHHLNLYELGPQTALCFGTACPTHLHILLLN